MSAALEEVTLDYPGTRALDRVSVVFRPGEVHGLIGENGAGKSSLVGILGGSRQPSAGRILLDGARTVFHGPRDALRQGIAHVSQEGSLVPHLSGAENILLGAEPRRLGVVVDRRALVRQAEALMRRWFPEVRIDLSRPVETLPYADQKLIEIVRGLRGAARLLILDEPTASLPAREKEALWRIIRGLPAQGVGIVLISHFLSEVLALSDRITVLRDGRRVATLAAGEADESRLVSLMLAPGKDAASAVRSREQAKAGAEPLLALEGWTGEGFTVPEFTLRPGEIVGLIGLTQAGHFEFARSLYDPRLRSGGTMTLGGRPVTASTPGGMRRLGVALVPDHRMVNALVSGWSVRENLSMAHVAAATVPGTPVLRRGAERAEARAVMRRLAVKAQSPDQPVDELSGGNKQKVSIGKWLYGTGDEAGRYRVLVFIEPTEGVDVGAKAEIHRIIAGLAAAGSAVVVASSDLHEVATLADRIIPFVRGRAGEELAWPNVSEQDFVTAMAGAA